MTTFPTVGTHGEGGVTRRKDGRLQVSITMPNGRRITRYVGKDSDGRRQRRKAEQIRRELVAARDRDLYPSEQTLGDYLRSWIAALPDGRKPPRPRTVEHYRYVVERYLIPSLGHVRLDRLTPRLVQGWVDGDRSRSAHHHYAVLRRALNVAKRQQVIADNPAAAIEGPERDDYKGSPLTAEQARMLMTATANDRLHALWRLAIDSGLRISELLGLAWDDVDFGGNDARADDPEVDARLGGRSGARLRAAGRGAGRDEDGGAARGGGWRGDPVTAANPRGRSAGDLRQRGLLGQRVGLSDTAAIHVRHQLYRSNGQWSLVPPKTPRESTIHIAPSTAAALKEHQRRMAEERTPDWKFYGLVFVTPKGMPFGRSDILRAFHAACDAAGIARRRVHDLRTSSASLLQDAHVPEHVRMQRLGHVTTRMARHYSGSSDVLDQEAAMAIEEVIG